MPDGLRKIKANWMKGYNRFGDWLIRLMLAARAGL